MNKKVFITGIAGSGSSYLAEHFLNSGYTVQGCVRKGFDRFHKNLSKIQDSLQVYTCDLNDISSVIRTLEVAQPDYIVNMAAHADVRACFDTPITVVNNNVNSVLNLLEAIRILKTDTVFEQISTSEVYGKVNLKPGQKIHEKFELNPISPYAISKLAGEQLVKSYYESYGIKSVILRSFSYINPRRGDIFSSSFARQIVEIEKGEKEKLMHGNLDSTRCMADIRDICIAYELALTNCNYGDPYNVGGSEILTVRDFLTVLISHAKVPIHSELYSKLLRPVDVTMQIPDVSKFMEQTGWVPKISMNESIEFLLNYYRGIK
jgi:GDP-mannose 4,6-dehydratase